MAESQATWPFNAVHRSHAVVTSMPVEAQPLDGPAPKHGSDQNNTTLFRSQDGGKIPKSLLRPRVGLTVDYLSCLVPADSS